MRPAPESASSELLLMLLADARLPSAGHTQSAQLEPAIRDGLVAAEVPPYVRLRLATVTRVEAATAVVALHHVRDGLDLGPVEMAWAARTPSAAMRATSRAMGSGLLRTVARLWPDRGAVGALRRGLSSRAVVLAVAADLCGLSARQLARLVGYDDVQTVTSATLKLLPLDPVEATTWVVDALPAVDRLADDVGSLTRPADIPSAGAPLIEVWAEAHVSAPWRLFSA